MLKNKSKPFLGFLQASGLVTYLILLATFFSRIPQLFKNDTAEFYAPIIMLLLFIISAVISASLVLGKSGVLFWEKKYGEAFTLVAWTLGWGIFYLLAFIALLNLI